MKSTYLREYEKFLSLIRKARKESGLTQQELAAALGRPQSFVSKYEVGERRLDLVEFIQVAKVLHAEPVVLLSQLATDICRPTPRERTKPIASSKRRK